MFDDDAMPAKQPGYMIGQTLDSMSVDEIKQTIERLKGEIDRLERTLAAKSGHLNEAETLFSKKRT